MVEAVLFFMLLSFFRRLKRSELLLTQLRNSQEAILDKMKLNAGLEQELVESFAQRQRELVELDASLEDRATALRKLVEQADQVSRSPVFLREVIMDGRRKGKSVAQLVKDTGLASDEVELIISQQCG